MAIAKGLEFNKRLDHSLRYLFSPHPSNPRRTIIMYLAGLMWAAVAGNFVYEWLKNFGSFKPLWFCLGAVAFLLIGSRFLPLRGTPPLSKAPEEAPPPPMGGIIMILSSYNRRAGMPFAEFAQLLDKENRTDEDWQTLELAAQQSNFDVPLQAIRYHMRDGSLRHVWLICTDDGKDEQGTVTLDDRNNPQFPGSWRLAHYLKKFVHESPHRQLASSPGGVSSAHHQVQFYYHSHDDPKWQYVVHPFGEECVRNVFEAVNFIFDKEVGSTELEPEQVICDFTGGRATHTIGMVLACLQARRRIQYTSSLQTSADTYVGRPRPIEIRVDMSGLTRSITLHEWQQSSHE